MGYYWLCYNVNIKNYCLIKASLNETFLYEKEFMIYWRILG